MYGLCLRRIHCVLFFLVSYLSCLARGLKCSLTLRQVHNYGNLSILDCFNYTFNIPLGVHVTLVHWMALMVHTHWLQPSECVNVSAKLYVTPPYTHLWWSAHHQKIIVTLLLNQSHYDFNCRNAARTSEVEFSNFLTMN